MILDVVSGRVCPTGGSSADVLRPRLSHSNDDLVIDAAVNGLADVIATFNLRDLRAPAARFGIAAEPPADVLRRIR